MENEQNIEPVPTTFVKRGNSIYMKIPPMWLKHLGLENLKKEDTADKTKGECFAQTSSRGEHYISGWNPEHPSQKSDTE